MKRKSWSTHSQKGSKKAKKSRKVSFRQQSPRVIKYKIQQESKLRGPKHYKFNNKGRKVGKSDIKQRKTKTRRRCEKYNIYSFNEAKRELKINEKKLHDITNSVTAKIYKKINLNDTIIKFSEEFVLEFEKNDPEIDKSLRKEIADLEKRYDQLTESIEQDERKIEEILNNIRFFRTCMENL